MGAGQSARRAAEQVTYGGTKVLIGMVFLSRVPGLVLVRPLISRRLRSCARSRSMVAALMLKSFSRTSGVKRSSPCRSSTGTVSTMNGARRLPARKLMMAQHIMAAARSFKSGIW